MKRNGKIEILRFIFCVIIILYHISGNLGIREKVYFDNFTIFARGRSGVEFFFLLSGFFCASLAYSQRDKKVSIGIDTYEYIKGKIVRILPYHLLSCAAVLCIYAKYNDDFSERIYDYIANVLLLQRTGVADKDLITIEWYICSMLLALAVIYPLLKKSFDFTAYVISPVASSLLIGYLIQKYNCMALTNKFGEYTYLCNIRALAVMLLGVFCFALTKRLEWQSLTRLKKLLLVGVENICWLFCLFFCVSGISARYEWLFIYSCAAAITICMSRQISTPVYQNKVAVYLGRLSLPLYLGQNITRLLYQNLELDLRVRYAVPLMLASVLPTGIILLAINDVCKKQSGRMGKILLIKK